MLIFNLPLVTKETIRYAESIAGFCTLLFVNQWSVNFIFLNASCDLWEIIGYLLCILYSQLCSAQAWLRYKTSSQAF